MAECREAELVGVILAGGLARRMGGGDKTLLDLGGRPLLAHVITRLKPQAGPMVLSANGDPARFAPFGLPVVPDTISGFAGPLAGLLAGMGWAATHSPSSRFVMTVAGDTPFFPAGLAARLCAMARAQPSLPVLARSRGRVHPVFGLWPVTLAPSLERALEAGRHKVFAWAREKGARYCDFAPDPALAPLDDFFNINTPADLDMARRYLQKNAS